MQSKIDNTNQNNARSAKRILIIGGGAAGLIAAWQAASLGADALIVEKNARLGTKILISGGGNCNLTHIGSMDEIRKEFRTSESRFLNPAFHNFTNTDILETIHAQGIPTVARPDGRVFPAEGFNARDVVTALLRLAEDAGVKFAMETPVDGIIVSEGKARGVRSAGETIEADSVIVAVGGCSYPATGTTGDGWRWAREIGHRVTPLRAALAPITLESAHPEWSGISLRDIVLRARTDIGGKEYARWRGDLLFTHKGISGPCVLGISREVCEKMAESAADGGNLEIDLLPELSFEALQTILRDLFRQSPRKTIASWMDGHLPERLREAFWRDASLDPATRGAHLGQREMNRLIRFVKGWSLGAVKSVPLERGEVVAGGIALGEVDSKTMASCLIKNLYFCGEILDIAGPVGGYNLQAAWSTGFTAGRAAAGGALRARNMESPNIE